MPLLPLMQGVGPAHLPASNDVTLPLRSPEQQAVCADHLSVVQRLACCQTCGPGQLNRLCDGAHPDQQALHHAGMQTGVPCQPARASNLRVYTAALRPSVFQHHPAAEVGVTC